MLQMTHMIDLIAEHTNQIPAIMTALRFEYYDVWSALNHLHISYTTKIPALNLRLKDNQNAIGESRTPMPVYLVAYY